MAGCGYRGMSSKPEGLERSKTELGSYIEVQVREHSCRPVMNKNVKTETFRLRLEGVHDSPSSTIQDRPPSLISRC